MEIDKLFCREANQCADKMIAPCGLEIRCIPQNFSTTYIALGVRFGSLDVQFEDKNGICRIPQGTAHFLEHKMFDMPDGTDAFEQFALIGASANAFTTNEYTAYVCQTTEHETDALNHLLRLVFSPAFTEEKIKKEKGIIEQEIVAYNDEAPYRAYMSLLGLMYREHPIRYEIAGSYDTINDITPELLSRVYKYFYRPSNMVLTICGKITIEEAQKTVSDVCGEAFSDNKPIRKKPFIDFRFKKRSETFKMDIARPLLALGYKWSEETQISTKDGYYLDIAASCLFGSVSPLYRELLENGYITRDFDGYFEWTFGAGHMITSCTTHAPMYVQKRLIEYLATIEQHLPSKELFEEMRSVVYADAILVFDSTPDTALSDLEERMCDGEYFEIPSIVSRLDYEEFCGLIARFFKRNNPFFVTIKSK